VDNVDLGVLILNHHGVHPANQTPPTHRGVALRDKQAYRPRHSLVRLWFWFWFGKPSCHCHKTSKHPSLFVNIRTSPPLMHLRLVSTRLMTSSPSIV
jgi:hypothetical protein